MPDFKLRNMRIQYLDGPRLRRALIAACQYAQRQRAELNRINVFPVPDGDTGTNLALTLASIVDRLRVTESEAVGVVAREVAEAGVLGARGNCGMILSHFLLGFSEAVQELARMTVSDFTRALRRAVDHVYYSLERPVEGTIVTVMRETAEEAEKYRSEDFAELLDVLLQRARDALARTPDLLPVLRRAGVVDAGAKGFVHILEGVVEYINGDPFVALGGVPDFGTLEPAVNSNVTALADRRLLRRQRRVLCLNRVRRRRRCGSRNRRFVPTTSKRSRTATRRKRRPKRPGAAFSARSRAACRVARSISTFPASSVRLPWATSGKR